MCHIICSEPNSPTFGWGIPHYFFSQSGLQNPHNGENSPLLDTLLLELLLSSRFTYIMTTTKTGPDSRAYYSWGADLRDEKHAPCLSDERVRFVTVKWLLNRFPCDKHYEYNTSE